MNRLNLSLQLIGKFVCFILLFCTLSSSVSEVETESLEYNSLDFVHVVVPTNCEFDHDWQVMVLFHSAIPISQRGPVTRLAFGCDAAKQDALRSSYAKLYPQFRVHFVPFDSNDFTEPPDAPKMIKHWLENGEKIPNQGEVVSVVGPDYIFLRPLKARVIMPNSIPLENQLSLHNPLPVRVQKGAPLAQHNNLLHPWLASYGIVNHTDKHCSAENKKCLKGSHRRSPTHYSIGWPVLIEASDLASLVNSWVERTPKNAGSIGPSIGYVRAAGQLQLPHMIFANFLVSNVRADPHTEGWKFIDDLGDDVCEPPSPEGIIAYGETMPNFLRIDQVYSLGSLRFFKNDVPPSLFECAPANTDLLEIPSQDFGRLRSIQMKNPDRLQRLSRVLARRSAFMICSIHRAINAAVLYYREKMCS